MKYNLWQRVKKNRERCLATICLLSRLGGEGYMNTTKKSEGPEEVLKRNKLQLHRFAEWGGGG